MRVFYSLNVALLTIQLPAQRTQTEFNLRRWAELLADPQLARFDGRVETDRHGRILMSPPPGSQHARLQARLAIMLHEYLKTGEVLTECPISTADGVRAADVAWASPERMQELGHKVCFTTAPEICVEVLSAANTEAELLEKMALYFDAGAHEVWVCSESGAMTFFGAGENAPMNGSRLCAEFPSRINLP